MIPSQFAQMHGAGWKARSEAAQAKIDKARDPERLAIAAVRALIRDIGEARAMAEAEFRETHAPVRSPIPAQIHRDVAAHLKAFLVKSGLAGADLLAPLNEHEPIESIERRHRERIQADLDQARAKLAHIEREAALERVRQAQEALAAVEANHARQEATETVAAPVEAPPQVPLIDRVEQALAEQAAVRPGTSDAEEQPEIRRGRGRPPKPLSPVQVVIEPDADVLPD